MREDSSKKECGGENREMKVGNHPHLGHRTNKMSQCKREHVAWDVGETQIVLPDN